MTHHSDIPAGRLPSRRNILTGAGVLAAIGAAGAMTSASALTREPIPSTTPYADRYVGVSKGQFVLNGRNIRFGGANNYYLHQKSHYAIDALLSDAAAMGLSVIRAWAFADGISPCMQRCSHAPTFTTKLRSIPWITLCGKPAS